MSIYIIFFYFFSFIICEPIYNGIDISVWQGPNINFKKVKEEGINFVILRAGIGDLIDKYFESNYKKAKEAGLNVGVYWHAQALTLKESEKEAEYILAATANKQLEYPVYYYIDQIELIAKGKKFCSDIAKKFGIIMEQKDKFFGIYTSKINYDLYFFDDLKRAFSFLVSQYDAEQCDNNDVIKIYKKSFLRNFNGVKEKAYQIISCFDFPSEIKNRHKNGF